MYWLDTDRVRARALRVLLLAICPAIAVCPDSTLAARLTAYDVSMGNVEGESCYQTYANGGRVDDRKLFDHRLPRHLR